MHSVLTLFFQLGHYLVSPLLLALVVTAGYSFDKRDRYIRLLLLLLFSLVFNPYLKSLWQIPLPPTAGLEGWSFPSGHMQTACVFWGWLAYELKNRWFYALIAAFLLNIGVGLVYLGYHYPSDILGAMVAALLLCTAYRRLLHHRNVLAIAIDLSAVTLVLIPQMPSRTGVWIGLGGMMGCCLGTILALWSNKQFFVKKWQAFALSLAGQIGGFGLIHYGLTPVLSFPIVTMLSYGIVVFWLVFNPWRAH